MDEKRYYNLIVAALDKIAYLRKTEIVLYPYGYWGEYTKRLLNERYGIKEAFIIDNKLCKVNPKIKSLRDLDDMDVSKYTFVITSDNPEIYEEIRKDIRRYVQEENIVDIFPKVHMGRDRRVESLRLMAEWMTAQKVPGNVAEVGVYKGYFSRNINHYFPEKKLYLFDTFEGFKNEQLSAYIDDRMKALLDEQKDKNNYCINSDIEGMLSTFPNKNNCIVKKGFFPETAKGVEDEFCLVSLDVDLYQGTKAGLEWFWPRMVKRGAIMVHDYNYFDCPGVKQAVDEFCIENGVGMACLPDEAGSIVLIK